jgi:hypothetical protein
MKILRAWAAGLLLLFAAAAAAQTTAPAGYMENPRQITSADRGPDIDPLKLAASKFNSVPLFRTFRSFVSASYATANVWIYAADDEPALYDSPVAYTWPKFYSPTWGEVFDHVARQTNCTWSWNPQNRQFKFERSNAPPPFGVTLPENWRREDRGLYIWHAPKDQNFGLDIFDFGQFTPPPDDADFPKKLREHFAMINLTHWPTPPTIAQMQMVKIGGADALYLKTDTPRPGGIWRQWSLVIDGHAFLIVSAMPKEREAELVPVIEKMVGSFAFHPPTTRPQTPVH